MLVPAHCYGETPRILRPRPARRLGVRVRMAPMRRRSHPDETAPYSGDGFTLGRLIEARRGGETELWAQTINPQFARILKTIGFDRRWVRTEGAYLYDADGTRFLDMLGGFGMFNVGRNNPRIRDALIEALELDLPGSIQMGTSPLPPLLAEALLERTPARLERVLFTSTGTESVEAAIKLGRAATKRSRVVSLEHAFHGLTLGSLSVSGCPEFRDRFEPLLSDCVRIPFGDLDALENELRREDVALFIVEPIQGKGVNLPPAGYLEGAQELCRRYGTLFCVDEVQTGFGRTGKLFAFEHWGLEPDMVPIAKSLSGGYVPVGALMMSKAVHSAVFDGMENALSHGSTFAPNELAMAAGLATLHEIDSQGLVERSARLGEMLMGIGRKLADKYEIVRDVRGLGLIWAIEFGEPPAGSRSYRMIDRMQPGLFAQFVIGPLFSDHHILSQVAGHNMATVKALPPLVVSEEDIEWFGDALDDSIGKARSLPRSLMRMAVGAARVLT
jgi:ornithine--oxo-acid transaminase